MQFCNTYVVRVCKYLGIPVQPVTVVFVKSRAELNKRIHRKTPSWLVGTVVHGKVYIFHKSVLKREISHPVWNYEKTLNHEITHAIEYRFVNGKRPAAWLSEGFACVMSGQKKDSKFKIEFENKGVADLIQPPSKSNISPDEFYGRAYWAVKHHMKAGRKHFKQLFFTETMDL